MGTTESWLDIIPAIPPNRCVPLRSNVQRDVTAVVLDLILGNQCRAQRSDKRNPTIIGSRESIGTWRVDLSDPQGFSYAFLFWSRRAHSVPDHTIRRFLNGFIDDAGRVALAKALREVTA